MRKILSLLFVLILALLMFAGTVYASESTAEEDISNSIVDGADETKSSVIDEAADYFKANILPLLTGAGSALLLALAVLVPYLKKAGNYKALVGLYSQTVEENNTLSELIKSGSTDSIKEYITTAIEPIINEINAYLKNLKEEITAEVKAEISTTAQILGTTEILSERLAALIKAAQVVWSDADGVTEILATSPTAAAVHKIALENKKLKAYIEEQKGEEALAAIAAIETDVEKAVNGIDESC